MKTMGLLADDDIPTDGLQDGLVLLCDNSITILVIYKTNGSSWLITASPLAIQ